jgi:Lon protease-like protein
LLENVMAEMAEPFGETDRHFEDASWVGYRLAEVLPLSLEQRQFCLEVSDPIQRLEYIAPLLESLSE